MEKVMQGWELEKIVSGGQTGVDRAALDVAIELGIPHGGWCPRGRWAEDGVIPERYHLRETPTAEPEQRTEWNVRDSDGTVIFSVSAHLTGGSAYTRTMAERWHKPWLHLAEELHPVAEAAAQLERFLRQYRIRVLNVAGPRRSVEPRAARYAAAVLEKALARRNLPPPTGGSGEITGC